MSGLIALANPRRIKVSHRRRRKVASGPSVQRYYDPGIGRFLSVDPVTANSGTGANFNRYWYANNNPYKFTDPDGRAACPGQRTTSCIEANTRIGVLKTSVNTTSEINQAIKSTAPLVAVPGDGPEKGVFIAAGADGKLAPVAPANATPGTTSSTSTLTMTVPAGVKPVAANHGHIDSGTEKSRGLASSGDGRTAVLAGYPVGVVSQGNIAVVTAPDGRLRIQVLEGSINRTDTRAVQTSLDSQQRALLEEGK